MHPSRVLCGHFSSFVYWDLFSNSSLGTFSSYGFPWCSLSSSLLDYVCLLRVKMIYVIAEDVLVNVVRDSGVGIALYLKVS
jgi:hypothetical protein